MVFTVVFVKQCSTARKRSNFHGKRSIRLNRSRFAITIAQIEEINYKPNVNEENIARVDNYR